MARTQVNYYLPGVTFAGQKVPPGDDRAVYNTLSDGILSGCSMSASGSSLTIAKGRIIAHGGLCRIDDAQTITVSGSSGFCRLLLVIDMTASADPFQKCQLWLEPADSIAEFPALTQNDINSGGAKYEMVLCMMALSGGGASILWTCGTAHVKAGAKSVTLPAANWSSHAQTVYVDGITPDTSILASYAPSSRSAYQAAGIYASEQDYGTITFACSTDPTVDVTVNLLLM